VDDWPTEFYRLTLKLNLQCTLRVGGRLALTDFYFEDPSELSHTALHHMIIALHMSSWCHYYYHYHYKNTQMSKLRRLQSEYSVTPGIKKIYESEQNTTLLHR